MIRVVTFVLALILLTCFMTTAPSSSSSAMQTADDLVKVWVDTTYNFYHCQGSKWYGRTKQGVYMTQKQARDRSYRPAYGVACKAPPPKVTKAPTVTKKG